ncbi:SDR family oxidoreductase [Frankia sp. CNm7]|uniref:SDR family oxidoreductase n=1 Tax=Frankia nepalensis TaxID=1836974 RepID=A0A937UVZ9_9ACTN|nr:SDR family NAD(P)-dependent oxidoreductase [Frankia nepalensis]MBL7501054.1 SDR family oxidoreductase [Frankia nepalensis]MBL7512529.1 SDR family oxidoreductase [Frankia nepalensis]MBL7520863.1 SDR family oxidoreductase [Frankia nepalensis]MBL7632851.1 SDR family oxidoreductase [Frankia nepalensis]
MEGLKDKVIIFAGGGGLATAAAKFLGAGGATVVVGDVVEASAESVVRAAKDAGGNGIAVVVDISDESQVKRQVDLAVGEYGRIDGLFNVAANVHPDEVRRDTNVIDIDLAAWQRTLDVNLTGYLLTLRHTLPHMIATGGGSVVNTMSGAAFGGMADKVAYSATKAGIGALTRHVASRYGKEGIRANGVAPGLVLTEMAKLSLPEDFRDAILAVTPARRHGEPDDIGALVAFLLSDLSEWVNGQTFSVDGGVTMR